MLCCSEQRRNYRFVSKRTAEVRDQWFASYQHTLEKQLKAWSGKDFVSTPAHPICLHTPPLLTPPLFTPLLPLSLPSARRCVLSLSPLCLIWS